MEETKKLKNTFNLIFALIIGMVFVTISGFVTELYKIHKNQKKLLVESIVENIKSYNSEFKEEFFINMDKAISLRVENTLKNKGIDNFEVVKFKEGTCTALSGLNNCGSKYNTFKEYKLDTIKPININDFTLIIVPIKMFKVDHGKVIIKIPHRYTTVNRLQYVALNILPLLIIVAAWFFLYRFVERNVITPQINKIADYESNKKVYETVRQVTHDLRSPIAVMNQVASNLDDSNQYKKLLKLSADRVNNIVNDFLEQTRLKNKELIIVDINDLVTNLLEEFKYKYKDIDFKVSSCLRSKVYLYKKDCLHLERSLSNIITNSTEAIISSGKISINISPDRDSFKIIIVDTGVGIKEEHQKHIFKNGHTTKVNGNGIGLSSTFKWLKSINGSIDFKSKIGMGTTFKILMPCTYEVHS